jgi:hypothetical protein
MCTVNSSMRAHICVPSEHYFASKLPGRNKHISRGQANINISWSS